MLSRIVSRSALCIALLFLEPWTVVLAQTTTTTQNESHKLIRANDTVGSLGVDLFGDEVNLYSGALSFAAVDVDLPGNDDLPMRIARKFSVESFGGARSSALYLAGAFGDWELDLPMIHGTFSELDGFKVAGPSSLGRERCTGFDEPPPAAGSPDGFFSSHEFWHGTSLYVPGIGDQEILHRSSVNMLAPGGDVAAYPLVTRDHWQIACTVVLQNGGESGTGRDEGYSVLSPSGIRYRFDWLTYRLVQGITKPKPDSTSSAILAPVGSVLARKEARLYPTLITDRFGNSVNLNWVGTQLRSMTASDGRVITLTYVNGTNRIATVSDGGRLWRYAYDANNNLDSVTRPGGTAWLYDLTPLFHARVEYFSPGFCNSGTMANTSFTGTITHPSGAVGTFTVAPTRHGRSYVPYNCITTGPNFGHLTQPGTFDTLALTNKQIAGPGLGSIGWEYTYSVAEPCYVSGFGGQTPPNPCPSTLESKPKSVSVRLSEVPLSGSPRDTVSLYTFGTRFEIDEGKLQKLQVGDGVVWDRIDEFTYASSAGKAFPNPVGYSDNIRGDADFSQRIAPQAMKRSTFNGVLNGVSFTWTASNWDIYGNPTETSRSSGAKTKIETTTYASNTAAWVLGLIDQVKDINTNVVELDIDYNSSALPITRKVFSRLDQTMTYCSLPLVSGCNAAGLLRTIKDGGNKTTTFGNHKSGIPQSVSFADMHSISGVVNDYGWVTAYTDELGYTTNYQYDDLGHLKKIIHPTSDSTAWIATDITFAPVLNTTEFGVGPGHWKQSITTGRFRKDIVFDALWRPVVTSEWDTNAPAETRQVARQFDADGREVFASYPTTGLGAFNAGSLAGVTKQFDALGRLERTIASSEFGPQTTLITYDQLTNSKTITNPNQQSTTIQYLQYDSPSEDHPIAISAPEGVNITIDRDVWGKPKFITRSKTGGETATRSFYYDTNQRLCKTVEPERGAEVFHYDSANRIDWNAAGYDVSTAAGCGDVSPALRILRTYDNRDRLTGVNYPGTATYDETRTYYLDGALQTAVLGAGQANEVKWEYQYNKRRLQTEARIYIGGESSAMNWTYNGLAQVSSVRQLNGFRLDYSPNAWGQPTQVYSPTRVLTYANGISYYPNGALKQFNYGNGAVHQMTPNTRQMPSRSWDVKGGTTIVDNSYTYDGNGNPKSIDDALNFDDKWLEYDGLDRLRVVRESELGPVKASMSYDALDNLTRYQVGSRDWTYVLNTATQRVTSVKDTATNVVQVSYQYDDSGNVNRRTQGTFDRRYSIDIANRLTAVRTGANSLIVGYVYDAQGRRTRTDTPSTSGNTDLRFQIYTPSGEFQWENDIKWNSTGTGGSSKQVNYVSLGGTLIAKQFGNSTYTTDTGARMAAGTLGFNPFANPYEGATPGQADGDHGNAGGNGNGNAGGNGNGNAGGNGNGNAGGNGNGNGTGGNADPNAVATAAVVSPETYSVEYVHTDALGSPVAYTSSTGSVLAGRRTQYEPYGTPTTTPRNGEPSYTGHQYDQTTGLIYAQARFYDPALGRFLSPDPIAVDTTSAFNFNRYAYANNSPYRFTDPDGRNAFAALELTLGAVAVDAATPDPTDVAAPAKGLSYSAAIVGTAIGGSLVWAYNNALNESTKPERQPAAAPDLPTGLVGENPRQTGKNGGKAIGTSLPADKLPETVKELTGGTLGPPDKNGRRVSPNGVAVRPNGKDGPRIDIPENGTKPPEIIHFPPGTPVPDPL